MPRDALESPQPPWERVTVPTADPSPAVRSDSSQWAVCPCQMSYHATDLQKQNNPLPPKKTQQNPSLYLTLNDKQGHRWGSSLTPEVCLLFSLPEHRGSEYWRHLNAIPKVMTPQDLTALDHGRIEKNHLSKQVFPEDS